MNGALHHQLTPTQLASHERSKAFREKCRRHAANLAIKPDDHSYSIPNTPYGVSKTDQKSVLVPKAMPPIPDEALREACELPTSNQFGPKIDHIYRTVALHFGVSFLDMISARRTKDVILPRHIAMYLAKTLTLRSLPEISRRMGNRDHTVALFAVRKISMLIRRDDGVASTVERLKEILA